MRQFTIMCVCAAVLSGLVVPMAQADGKVDNPIYKHWAQFKVGSFSTLKTVQTVKVAGTEMKTETTMTTTLKELTAEKAVVEIVSVTKTDGNEIKTPAIKQEYPAKITKEEYKKQKEPENQIKVKEGKEELKIAGKTIKTTWTEVKMKQGDMDITTKSWISEEIPGQIVKMSTTTKGEIPMTSEGEVVKFKAEKK